MFLNVWKMYFRSFLSSYPGTNSVHYFPRFRKGQEEDEEGNIKEVEEEVRYWLDKIVKIGKSKI